jgi:hypothetical protein
VPADFTDHLKAGISIFDICLRFDWSGPEQYDFKRADEKLEAYLKLEPKALFLPRVLLTPGPWWCKEFPTEITMRDDGGAGRGKHRYLPAFSDLSNSQPKRERNRTT